MKITAVAIAMVIVLGCFVWVLVDAAMPSNAVLTRARISQLRAAIEGRVQAGGEPPAALADLRLPGGAAAPTEDYWKRPLSYEVKRVNDAFHIALGSLGKDGQVGGSGESKDIEVSFEVKQPGAIELSPGTTLPATTQAVP